MPRLNIEMGQQLLNEFKELCETDGRTMSDVLRQIIRGYIIDEQLKRNGCRKELLCQTGKR